MPIQLCEGPRWSFNEASALQRRKRRAGWSHVRKPSSFNEASALQRRKRRTVEPRRAPMEASMRPPLFSGGNSRHTTRQPVIL